MNNNKYVMSGRSSVKTGTYKKVRVIMEIEKIDHVESLSLIVVGNFDTLVKVFERAVEQAIEEGHVTDDDIFNIVNYQVL